VEKILSFMEPLIEEGKALELLAQEPPSKREQQGFTRRFRRWSKNIFEILEYTSMASHLADANAILNRTLTNELAAPALAGILESAYDLIKHGLVGKIKFQIHAEMFSSIGEQAKALNDAGHSIPAAVLGRIAIENWLRDQVERAGIEAPPKAKAAVLNDKLKQAGVFSVPRWMQIQFLLGVGNSAAHGKDSEFTHDDVSKLLEFVETNCTT